MPTLKLPQGYAWRTLLALYNDSGCREPTERADPKSGVLEGIVELERSFWYRLERTGNHLELTLNAPDGAKKPSKKEYEAARAWATRRLWLGVDFDAMRAALEVNLLGFRLADAFHPVVPPAYSSYWSALLRIYGGRKFDGELRGALGTPVQFGGKTYARLPSAEQVVTASLKQENLGLSPWADRKVIHIAHTYLQREDLQLEHLPAKPESALERIVDGFELGRSSAVWVLMRGAIRNDVALEGTGFRKMLAEGMDLPHVPKVKEFNALMQVYAPYRSFASYYLHLSHLRNRRKNWMVDEPETD